MGSLPKSPVESVDHSYRFFFLFVYDGLQSHDGSMVLGIYANITGGILMGSMLPYIAAPWILWEYLLGGAITIKKTNGQWEGLYIHMKWKIKQV